MRKIDLTSFQLASSETARQITRRIALNFIRRHEPLSRAELEAKATSNLRSGGWAQAQVEPALALARNLWDGPVDLALLRM